MNTRALILTIGTSLLLLAPAAQAARTSNALSCAHAIPSLSVNAHKPFFSQLNPRGLQAAGIGLLPATGSRSTCGAKPTTTVVAPNHLQILRNAV